MPKPRKNKKLNAKIDRLKATLNDAREYIDMVRRNHWPDAIPAANILHEIDAALAAE